MHGLLCGVSFQTQYFYRYLESDSYEVWQNIGNCILASRVLILVMRFNRHNLLLSDVCYAVTEAKDHGFMYVFLQMFVDTVQTFTFSLVPFP